MQSEELEYLAEQEIGAALERLEMNPDFQLAVQQAYLQDHALERLGQSVAAQHDDRSKAIYRSQAEAAAHLRAWIGNAKRLGRNAQANMEELRASRERLKTEWGQ